MKIILTILFFFSGILASHNTQVKSDIATVPTIAPTVTPSPTQIPTSAPTPIPTLTYSQYLDENVTLHNCQTGEAIQIKRSELPSYGKPYNYVPNIANCQTQQINNNDENNQIYQPKPVYNYYTPPPQTVYHSQPIHQPENINCTTSGNYTNCSDGSSAIRSGSSTFINGGSNGNSGSCITSGNYTSCSDGSSSINSGNESFISGNGTSSTCTHFGNTTTCN